jgi:Tat protein translocase TatC
MNLPEDLRENFVNSLDEEPLLKNQVKSLIKTHPKTDNQTQGNLNMMSALKPTEGFMLSMKLSFVAGIVLSFPLLLLFILQFVLPGLHSHEKRVMWPALSIGFGLFLMGAAFAYYLVLPKALMFFYTWSGGMGISNDWRIGEYIAFATQFTLLFGASFELPVVVMVFVKLGLLSYETMSRTRSYAILAIFVAAAILTPTPDIPTMLLMATPMIVLYEICIWLAYLDRKKARIREEQEARERIERLVLKEEQRKKDAEIYAAEHPQDPVEDAHDDWHDSHPDYDPHAGESADDGWVEEYPQRDPHALIDTPTPELPEAAEDLPTTSLPDSLPEEENRRLNDP